MKRIGILTVWRSGNYGAELQAYALQKKLNLAGFDAEVIDYPFYKSPEFRLTPRGKSPFDIGWKNHFKEWLLPKIRQTQSLLHPYRAALRNRNFESFYRLVRHSGTRFVSFDQLYDAGDLGYDIYISGSDQIWNPRTYASIEPFFLTFAPSSAIKISYAASFGVSGLPDTVQPYYRAWLKNLNAVSVREADAVALVNEISGQNAVHVLDPTMLLPRQEWQKIAVKHYDDGTPYLLLYDVTPSPETVILAKKIAHRNHWRIIRICPDAASKKIAGMENIFTAGPSEFIDLIDKASFIVTNSFHGSVFAILFEKPFFTVKPATTKNGGRLSSLLQKLNLPDRMIPAEKVQNPLPEIPFGYTGQQKILAQMREKSMNFLYNAMEKQK